MIKIIKQISVFLCLLSILTLPYFVFAATPLANLQKVGGPTGAGYSDYGPNTFDNVIGTIIQAFLGLLGVIFIILMLYGGYRWMTSAGDDQKVNSAKDTINRAIVGLIIVVGSFAIWEFISRALFK